MLTPFGTMDFGDPSQVATWTMAHAARHITYTKRMGALGMPVTTTDLYGEINSDWIGRHLRNHLALNRGIAQVLGTTNFTAQHSLLALEGRWDDANHFYAWHRVHNLVHLREDQQLGITATYG
jgi:hypothetical protein